MALAVVVVVGGTVLLASLICVTVAAVWLVWTGGGGGGAYIQVTRNVLINPIFIQHSMKAASFALCVHVSYKKSSLRVSLSEAYDQSH